jgi:amino acid transporter
MLVNVAYFAVLSADEILESNAVAVTFASHILGPFAHLMPLCVAASCVGGLNGSLFGPSRMFYVGARNGQLPELLSMINVRYLTPMPSLVLLCILSLFMLISSDVIALINYTSFAESSMVGLAVAGLLYLRWLRPELERPIKVITQYI